MRTDASSKLRGSFVDPRRSGVLPLGAWATDWLAAQADLSPTTRARYKSALTVHIVPCWERVRLADVTHAEVQRWLTGLGGSPASVPKVHRVLSMAESRPGPWSSMGRYALVVHWLRSTRPLAPETVETLTPRLILPVLASGYRPLCHPTLRRTRPRSPATTNGQSGLMVVFASESVSGLTPRLRGEESLCT